IWQQHEGAVRLLFWLLFKVRIGQKQRITVQTLMRVAYGEARLNAACSGQTLERKKLLRLFEGDLATLYHYGLRPEFDPVTYPDEIQPFWARVVDLPDDADEALEFWINDGHNGTRLTDAAPRGKWNRLMSARILSFALPADWEQRLKRTKTRKSNKQVQRSAQIASSVSGQVVTEARQKLGLSQRALASQLGKSQSWVRDIERDRFQVSPQDSKVLSEVLSLPQESR
ncbi:MAG: helix-turn-helix transcriptional regulator, partial [Cyanobacteria bacterium P01_H01_bin.121]